MRTQIIEDSMNPQQARSLWIFSSGQEDNLYQKI